MSLPNIDDLTEADLDYYRSIGLEFDNDRRWFRCPKCKGYSGDDWSHCPGNCPVTISPYHLPPTPQRGDLMNREDNKPVVREITRQNAIEFTEDLVDGILIPTNDGKDDANWEYENVMNFTTGIMERWPVCRKRR